jgi:hypothetical protein
MPNRQWTIINLQSCAPAPLRHHAKSCCHESAIRDSNDASQNKEETLGSVESSESSSGIPDGPFSSPGKVSQREFNLVRNSP